ncbi:MAG: hypothetical protein RLZZ282_98, partial [Verrucomicrobiota bacterium]
ATPAATPAANPPATPAVDLAKPQIKKLDESRYQIGEIIMDQKSREIRFPAKVNITEGLVEYLVCLQQGRIHEALLITEIAPIHLRIAFTLLRFPASNELFSTLDETGHMTGIYPDVPLPVQAGARIAIDVEWNDNGTTQRKPINEWVQQSAKNTDMMVGPWLYTGSEIVEGKFIPACTGDLAAITVNPGAMINYPGSDNVDNGWNALSKRIPSKGTPVTLIITPFYKPRPVPTP